MVTRVLLLAAAGAAGALTRYFLSALVQRHTPGVFPLATFLVNLSGCFLFGFLWALTEVRQIISPDMRAILLTGFLGAFTTFSAFAYENANLWKNGHWYLLGINVLLQNVLGIALVFAGMHLGRGSGS